MYREIDHIYSRNGEIEESVKGSCTVHTCVPHPLSLPVNGIILVEEVIFNQGIEIKENSLLNLN